MAIFLILEKVWDPGAGSILQPTYMSSHLTSQLSFKVSFLPTLWIRKQRLREVGILAWPGYTAVPALKSQNTTVHLLLLLYVSKGLTGICFTQVTQGFRLIKAMLSRTVASSNSLAREDTAGGMHTDSFMLWCDCLTTKELRSLREYLGCLMSHTRLGSGNKILTQECLMSEPLLSLTLSAALPQTTLKACCELYGDIHIKGVSTPGSPSILTNHLLSPSSDRGLCKPRALSGQGDSLMTPPPPFWACSPTFQLAHYVPAQFHNPQLPSGC